MIVFEAVRTALGDILSTLDTALAMLESEIAPNESANIELDSEGERGR